MLIKLFWFNKMSSHGKMLKLEIITFDGKADTSGELNARDVMSPFNMSKKKKSYESTFTFFSF